MLYQGHSEEIICMGVSKDGTMACTGQKANPKEKDPYFILWDTNTGAKLAMVFYHDRAITSCCFDDSGNYLITIGGYDKLTLAVWRVKELIDTNRLDRSTTSIKRITKPLLEHSLGKCVIHFIYVDPHNSRLDYLELIAGAEKTIKYFLIDLRKMHVEEKKALFF